MTRRPLPLLVIAAAALTRGAPARAAEPKLACIAAADQGHQLRDDGKYRRARPPRGP
jgi:hypothetical protein